MDWKIPYKCQLNWPRSKKCYIVSNIPRIFHDYTVPEMNRLFLRALYLAQNRASPKCWPLNAGFRTMHTHVRC